VYEPWLLLRHYAKRLPTVQHAFGVFVERECVGVVTFGPPPSPQVAKSVITIDHRNLVIELNRLCVDDNAPRNASSVLVGGSLRLLPRPSVVVSYADGAQGHVGYIYQATNFGYFGLSPSAGPSEYELPNGTFIHRRTIVHQGRTDPSTWAKENGYKPKDHAQKHRYVYLCGSPRQKRTLTKALLWKPETYPKGETRRYEASAHINSQPVMF
jgi:hypothetical protein